MSISAGNTIGSVVVSVHSGIDSHSTRNSLLSLPATGAAVVREVFAALMMRKTWFVAAVGVVGPPCRGAAGRSIASGVAVIAPARTAHGNRRTPVNC